jgi:hypothetical protein
VGACNLFAIQSFTTASLDAIKRKSGCFSDPPVPPDEQSLKSSNVAYRMVIANTLTLRPTEFNSYNPRTDFSR